MKKGDSVKVKQGILDPDLNQFDMSGWQGRITDITSNNESNSVEIRWDSITLKQLPKEFIENCKFQKSEEYQTRSSLNYHCGF